jgi:hypothetical protein
MRRHRRRATLGGMLPIQRLVPIALAGAVIALPAAADAAPPLNDTFGTAAPIAALPFFGTVDTTEATLDADDQEVGAACGLDPSAFVVSNSVWYAYTPVADETIAIDTGASSYPVAGAVVSGAPGSFDAVTCFASSSTQVTLSAGTTYHLDLVQFGPGNGGTLALSVTHAVAPELAVTVDGRGTFTHAGTATISGTATCTGGAGSMVFAQLTQMAGRGRLAAISGFVFGESLVACDGAPHPWSLTVTPGSGKFRGGQAGLMLFASTCSFITCDVADHAGVVRLRH